MSSVHLTVLGSGFTGLDQCVETCIGAQLERNFAHVYPFNGLIVSYGVLGGLQWVSCIELDLLRLVFWPRNPFVKLCRIQ